MSCDHRSCENDIDYARGFFALLGLEWKLHFTYEDGILEILRSRPHHAARLAGMHGPRGLPAPYSWAPRYLARLQGRIYGGFDAQLGSLIGYWHTVVVERMVKRFVADTGSYNGCVCNLIVTEAKHGGNDPDQIQMGAGQNSSSCHALPVGQETEIQIQFYPEHWTTELEDWLEKTIPSGKARLLCGEGMDVSYDESTDQHARIVLAATSTIGPVADLNLDDWGPVAGSAVVNSPRLGRVRDGKLRWFLE
ncbi:hypothetical protein A1O1_01124 [Capronia coronata CBS 617.96]|uniref:Uncharacterized protein n=1 Tax=Capronia coronata CBS 617.96 TaxID=1182541 RepID=W9YU00_9EURO|nr:uncharacterized protein A1O1_01124 [Capronia coronata CBS 617.96]EXJ95998.1 hypothetical protein A1O1_01124 [Capronia coronata CBS 617.96]